MQVFFFHKQKSLAVWLMGHSGSRSLPSVSFHNSSSALVNQPSHWGLVCVYSIFCSDPRLIFSVTVEHSIQHPPTPSPRWQCSLSVSFCWLWCYWVVLVCLWAPRFLLDGPEPLTSSIWNAGRTPVTAGLGTEQNHFEVCWYFFPFSLSPSLFLCVSLPADHKKTYGEEHGSCQAGIAGAFMEVSSSAYQVQHEFKVSLMCIL